MKILRDEGISLALESRFGTDHERFVYVAEAQHKDTLRQVGELLDGIENPYNDTMTGCLSRDYRIQHTTFEEAVQAMKALLEE